MGRGGSLMCLIVLPLPPACPCTTSRLALLMDRWRERWRELDGRLRADGVAWRAGCAAAPGAVLPHQSSGAGLTGSK